jgi:Sugar phosphate isomerases/epimerases
MDRIFLQMYSFGNNDPANMETDLKLAADMGYCGVELFGPNFVMETEKMKRVLEENHLTAISLHTQTDKVLEMIPYAKALGLRFVGIGMEYLPDAAAAEAFAKRLNEIGAACSKEGIMLTYHNHTQEFKQCGEKKILEIIAENTNPDFVGLELDAGWCAAAGDDPIAFVRKYNGRVKLIHVKESSEVLGVQPAINFSDMKFDEAGRPVFSDEMKRMFQKSQEINCAAGEGIVDWKKLREAADACGCEAYIVEREYTYSGDRLECLEADIDYYKKNM